MADDDEGYRLRHYRLEGTKVVRCNFEEWLEAMKKVDVAGTELWYQYTKVAKTRLHNERFLVSTIFLAMDMRFGPGEPQLFETQVVDEEAPRGTPERYHDQYMERYSTWTEAEQGHQKIVDQVKVDLPLILASGEIDDEKEDTKPRFT